MSKARKFQFIIKSVQPLSLFIKDLKPDTMAHCEADRVTKEPPDRGKDGVLEEEFPALSGAAKGVTQPSGAAQAAPLYSERLKSNVKYDQRLKRNVLEVCLFKNDDLD